MDADAVMVFGVGDAPICFLLAYAAVADSAQHVPVRQLDRHWLLLAKALRRRAGRR